MYFSHLPAVTCCHDLKKQPLEKTKNIQITMDDSIKNENNGAATRTIALLSVLGLPDRLHVVSQLLLEKRACPGILGFPPFVFGPVQN